MKWIHSESVEITLAALGSVKLIRDGTFALSERVSMKFCCFVLVSLAATWGLVGIAGQVAAGEFNTVLDIGDPAPEWSELPTTAGETSSLKDLSDSKFVVLAFTCNSCPYAVDAEKRLISLTKDYAEKSVSVIAVNVNTIEDDAMPAMKVKAAEKSFPFAYLYDESQQIARDYGAKYTPQFFLLDADRKIAYMGAMDDSPDGQKVTQPHLRNAIDEVLAGEPVTLSETVPVGCRIRMERQRRSRRQR
ncbi:thioredoxin family protein [Rhodopirellula bahusiensis]|uniref:Thioredoxin family protein n=1 Tax=Rhodopirellula bahusiensis TaxID=2014065 RepID=A0A2G1WA38_9BACT|nr:thioredoxin family protein [Rhodopirellula bahusiensis]